VVYEVEKTGAGLKIVAPPINPIELLKHPQQKFSAASNITNTLQDIFDKFQLPQAAQTLLALQWLDFLLPPNQLSLRGWHYLEVIKLVHFTQLSFDDFPAELAIPTLRAYISTNWVRLKGGVYTYIEKILERFKGKILLGVEIDRILRSPDGIKIMMSTGEIHKFDRIVFATPPDQVMALLADPTAAETKRFSEWKANHIISIVHKDTLMYDRFGIHKPSEFDFFQTDTRWGYNGYLNQLCDISSPPHYFLSFQLEELIAPEQIIHTQAHHTPMYTTESFRYRDEVVATNGDNHTYHAGAYLGDGLHGGAITAAVRVAKLIGVSLESISSVESKRERIPLA
jgi:uncharacterized protein